jgi:hypothetical protein
MGFNSGLKGLIVDVTALLRPYILPTCHLQVTFLTPAVHAVSCPLCGPGDVPSSSWMGSSGVETRKHVLMLGFKLQFPGCPPSVP